MCQRSAQIEKVVRLLDWVAKSIRSRYLDVSFGTKFSFLVVNKAKHNQD